jgi:membrane protein YdbS with pleckstrin-like domain
MREPSLFAVGAGGYVAGTVGTLLVTLGPTPFPLVVAGGVAVAVAVTAAAVRPSTPERIERFHTPAAQVAAVIVPVLLAAAVVTVHHGLFGPNRAVFWPGMVGVGVAALGAVAGLYAAERQYAARVEAESDVRVVLPDPSADESGTRWRLAGLALGVVASALFVGNVLLGDGLDTTWLFATLAGLVPLLTARQDSELVVLDAGLKQGVSIRPWRDFRSYEVTDEELVIRDGSWFPRQYAIPRSEIENEDAAIAALSRYLPEE